MDLLRRFIRDRSETAFRGLVELHSPLVYATALRRLAGDRAAAQDVTQEVFTLLAGKATALQSAQLGGWLYRQTCRRAANHVRSESRRRAREAVAAMAAASHSDEETHHPDLAGEVDEAMLSLHRGDRDALILRFLEARDFRNVGSQLGISEEAARKRVSRALEKLCALLKRRGIAVGSAALGTSMNGMAATPVPAGLVSTVTAQAMKSTALGSTSITLWPLLKAGLAGTLLTSLAAGAKLAADLREHASGATAVLAAGTPAPAPARSVRPGVLGELPPGSSLEDVIQEIKRVQSGPANSLTRLRIGAILERVSIAQIPEFITLGNEMFSPAERDSTYSRLLYRWATEDRVAAADFVLREQVGKQVDKHSGTNLLSFLIEDWVRSDRHAATRWLMAHWDHPELSRKASYGNWRTSFSLSIAREIFQEDGGPAAMIALITSLPDPQVQANVMRGLYSDASWEGLQSAGVTKLLELHHALEKLPDAAMRRQASVEIWKIAATQQPQEVEELLARLEPTDQIAVRLGLLGAIQKPGKVEELDSGGIVENPEPVTDQAAREQAALDAAIASGLSRQEALNLIAPVILESLQGMERFAWLDAHSHELDLDPWLEEQARRAARINGMTEYRLPEMDSIAWASRIHDPELRLRLCRAAFRRMFRQSDPKSLEIALAYSESKELPADLAAEFRKILTETP